MATLRIFLSLSLLVLISCSTENVADLSSDTSLSVLLNGVEWKDLNKSPFGNELQISATGTMATSSEEKRVNISFERILDDRQGFSFSNVPATECVYYLEKSADMECKFLQSVGREDLLMCKSYELLDYPEAAAKAGLKNFINIEKHDEENRQISGSFNVSFLLKESYNCSASGEANLPDTLNFTEGRFKFNY